MSQGRDPAAGIASTGTTGTTVDAGDATSRRLLYGLLPSWFVPGLADRVMHRRTRIEDAWRPVPRRPQLPPGHLAGIAAAIGACVLLPYGEELPRCPRAAGSRKRRVGGDAARWLAPRAEKRFKKGR
ncbi:hypothetical protein ADK57_00335 [Streptomyces sp. MMG1533]|uniref:hypothetical protein n=1 Tax=Streptomyces sp. MMG1533 TaxID=1415546 RepID=UPI0006AE520A|nr:hypothetical protein [Streptomyces sp. MMG1533]KOU77902.1 hypothetical protein ADK57_00335 [Streptomyces sp. MMG1533]